MVNIIVWFWNKSNNDFDTKPNLRCNNYLILLGTKRAKSASPISTFLIIYRVTWHLMDSFLDKFVICSAGRCVG